MRIGQSTRVVYVYVIMPNSSSVQICCPYPTFGRSLSFSFPNALYNAVEAPVALLGPIQNLLSLLREVGLAAVTDDVFEEDGLPGLIVLLPLPGLLSLGLLQGHLYFGCLGKLLGEDSLGDASPQAE